MPILGAHMSIAGGYHLAVQEAHRCTCDCVQLFTKNNNQWRAKEITAEEAGQFQQALAKLSITHPLSHSSYLINLASPDDALWEKSTEGMAVELRRAEQLGIPYVVVHPGSHTTSSEEEGLARIALALDMIHKLLPRVKAQVLLEITAGQGTNLGWKFSHLADILGRVAKPQRVGICFDTCHAFAAGYDLRDRKTYLAMWREFDELLGLERLKAIHLNDSKRELGSRIDRHEHIGRGCIGLEGFRHLLTDRRFRDVPMYLETPKENPDEEPWDVVNLRTLRELVR
ncbi:MAG: deoxyribonuclease IV [Verrucomicrobiales bacterium]|nr:deoxyribonuclease IV [Verrucomicrobiales bacterium]